MRFLKSRKSKVAVATVAVLALGGGAAFAYWLSSGTGAGAGTTGVSTAFTVAGDGVTSGVALIPGGPSQTVGFTVTNPSTGNQYLTDVAVTVANADGTAWLAVPGCSAADYSIGAITITGGAGDIAPAGTKSGTVVVSMTNLPSDQGACQGVAYPLYFVAS